MSRPLFQARIASARRQDWTGLHGSARSLAIATAAADHDGVLLVLARSSHQAQVFERDLRLLGDPELPVVLLPDRETLPYDPYSAHPDIAALRLAALARMSGLARGVVVAPAALLLQRLPPKQHVLGQDFRFAPGDALSLEGFRERLAAAGYEASEQVYQAGQFAVRGSVIDLFPTGRSLPLRIDLFDQEIDSIREFDPETQRSVGTVERLEMFPAREYPSDPGSLEAFRRAFRYRFAVDMRQVPLYQDLRGGAHPQGLEQYLPLFFEATASVLDYLPDAPVLVLQDGWDDAIGRYAAQTRDRWEQRRHDTQRPILDPSELLFEPAASLERLAPLTHIRLGAAGGESATDFGAGAPPELPVHDRGQRPASALIRFAEAFPGQILFAADTPGRREYLAEALHALGLSFERHDSWGAFRSSGAAAGLAVLPVEEGFQVASELVILTETQLFGGRARRRAETRRSDRDPESIIRDLADLAEGSPVVHEDHGVGRYGGLEVLEIDGRPAEFLKLEYADSGKLYVPVSSLHLVSRYTGAAPEDAPLHRLGGERWKAAKRRAAQKVRDVAAELLDLYARREARAGFAFPFDQALYLDFCASFPFEETPDQQRAIDAVVGDMLSDQPMDRVVCGDVGFGKTEVALRAAFLAVQGGKQVALLVPTTLLAQQHHATFSDRFADWPVRIELLSRFRSAGQVRQVLDDLEAGRVDIVIGTHRLLQSDIRFDRLGLVIVDEEQRFGVRQKERLKQLRSEVDLLTLTATPIPRTLNMAMSGIRDLSIIATPPARRMAVKTLIVPWDAAMLREALQREIQRGGQVFFLHNEVRSIQRLAREVGELVPEARIRVAHGQMKERELEQVMLDFYRQRFNVLVCTTIIENGIDVPTANTIVVNRADRFGLAQLHQLRGRVGRSHHRAYAYLVVPDQRAMTGDARKRLEAIASLEELGAGFTLATHDMEIRGAGELLGEDQSGQIQQIGFGLYSEYLKRAVSALSAGQEPEFGDTAAVRAEVELHLPALIPEDYLADVHARLTLYKRIASAESDEALRALQVEMIDRFGLLPEPVRHLFRVARLRRRADVLGIRRIDLGDHGGRVEFGEGTTADPAGMMRLIEAEPGVWALRGPSELGVRLKDAAPEDRFETVDRLLGALEPAVAGTSAK